MLLISIASQPVAAAAVNDQDTTGPSITVNKPAGYTDFEVGSSITVEGTASDYSGVSIVEVKLGGGSYFTATGTQTWTVQVPVPADFPLGGNTLTIRATDANGNMAYSSKNVNIVSTSATTSTSTSTNTTNTSTTTTTTSSSTSTTSSSTPSAYHYSPAFTATGSNYYDIPDNSALRLQTFSLASWFNTAMTVSGPSAIIAGKGGFGSETAGSNMNYGIWLDYNSNIVAGFEDTIGSNFFVHSKLQYNDSKWHYSVVTFDGQQVKLYIDGQAVSTLSTTAAPDNTGTQTLRIGGNALQNNRYYQGLVDEVRVWNRAVTLDEVSAQYASGTFSQSGALAYMNGSAYKTYYSNSGSSTGTNAAPVANAGPDKTVIRNSVVYLDGNSSYDPNGNPLTFSWTQTSGPAVTLSNPTSTNPSFIAANVAYGSAATLSFSLKVSDGAASSSDTVNITDVATDTQAPTGSIQINSGKQYTSVSNVALALSCTDSESGCAQMRISVDGTFDTEVFVAFATSKSVTLPSGDGLKTVMIVFKDAAGNVSPIYSDSIILDTKAPSAPVITTPATGTTTISTKPTFGGTAEASSTVTVYYVTGTSTTNIGTVKASILGSWSVAPSTNMAAATYSIQAKTSDAAGNVSPASATVKLTISTTTTITTPSTSYTYTFCSSGCTYSSLQTAINALPSGGGSILIKDGQYKWSNTISLKSGTSLVFSSGAYITFTGSSKDVFSGSGVSNVSIKGGSITAQYSGVKAIAFYSSKGIHVDGTAAYVPQGSNSNGFYCQDCIDVYVSNMNIKMATRGIDMKTSVRDPSSGLSQNIWIQNNVVANTSVEGMHINWVKDAHIIGNKVSNTLNNGIDIGYNINSEVRGNSVYKTGIDGEGIHTDSTNTALVIDNYIDTTGGTGITIYRAAKVNVTGNTILHAGGNGINVIDSTQTSSYATVKSNYVSGAALDGIYESPNQYKVEIAYNKVANVASGYSGIKVIWSNNPTTSVHDNTVV